MNINDNKLNELMEKTERMALNKVRRRKLILSASLGTFSIAVAIIAFSVLAGLRQVPDVTIGSQSSFAAASSNTSVPATPTPLPDGSTWDPSDGPTPVAFSPSVFKEWTEHRVVEGINVDVTLALDTIGVPSLSTLSTVEVQPGTFDLAFAEKAVEYFLGSDYYEDFKNKSDLQMIYEADKRAYENFRAETEDEKNVIQENLNSKLKAIEKAPAENIEGKIEYDESGYFSLKGYSMDNCISSLSVNRGDSDYAFIRYRRGDVAKDYWSSEIIDEEDEAFNTAVENLSPQAAQEMADEIAAYFDEDMQFAFALFGHAYNYRGNSQDLGEVMANKDAEKSYVFYYTRRYPTYTSETLSGTDVFCIDPVLHEDERLFAGNEVMKIILDKDGIFSFSWSYKTDTLSISEQNLSIISPDEAVAVFKEQIFDTKWRLTEGSTTELKVNTMFMEMVRIKDDDGGYLMVPTYVFKGTQRSIAKDTGTITTNYSELDYANLFMVNAIDGSVID